MVERGMARRSAMAWPLMRVRRSVSISVRISGVTRTFGRAGAELLSRSMRSPPALKRASHL